MPGGIFGACKGMPACVNCIRMSTPGGNGKPGGSMLPRGLNGMFWCCSS